MHLEARTFGVEYAKYYYLLNTQLVQDVRKKT